MSLPGARFALVREPLSIFNSAQESGRVSKIADWKFHYEWAITNRKYFSRRALTYFLSTVCVEDAAKQGKRFSASSQLVAAISVYGSPSAKSWLFFIYYLLFSEQLRQRIRIVIAAVRKRTSPHLKCESLS
jgi:hypothetical protein